MNIIVPDVRYIITQCSVSPRSWQVIVPDVCYIITQCSVSLRSWQVEDEHRERVPAGHQEQQLRAALEGHRTRACLGPA